MVQTTVQPATFKLCFFFYTLSAPYPRPNAYTEHHNVDTFGDPKGTPRYGSALGESGSVGDSTYVQALWLW
ncbi:hypothetical protein LMH87_010429 [Akanthomyces muscarius]|uniref:Uncharacterized protein n=1 Tax=Akanthomyces muscarius TaxID=2231603 RepID=A0A9W8QGN1_AKAMU|nr:hypothetical protein LMH87_010429 [Akanthomyces muscarius]KAJ4153964.1 hypothetical protein LMH87_010429 [Akanthomyces muscarius]